MVIFANRIADVRLNQRDARSVYISRETIYTPI